MGPEGKRDTRVKQDLQVFQDFQERRDLEGTRDSTARKEARELKDPLDLWETEGCKDLRAPGVRRASQGRQGGQVTREA